MSRYEKVMAEVEVLKAELDVLKVRYEIGQIDRDSYRDSVLRIDERLSELRMLVLKTLTTLG